MKTAHAVDAFLYGFRGGKLYYSRAVFVLAVITWATWYRARPWDSPTFRLRYVAARRS